jgi:hypothetical protein
MLNQKVDTNASYLVPLRVIKALRYAGIQMSTRSWADYEAGKRAIASMGLNELEYSIAVDILARWVVI